MAYRRKTSRVRKGRTNRRKRLSPHMVRAIKAISAIPVETKRFAVSSTFGAYLSTAGYISGPSAVIRANIFSDIPRIKDTSVKTETSMVGNEIQSRGLRWEFKSYPSLAANAPPVLYRFTVYKDDQYFQNVSGPANTDRIFDPNHTSFPTWSEWNSQTTSIIFRRSFRLKQSTSDPGLCWQKFYVPLRKKCVSQNEESTLVNTFLGEMKGMQYYWVLETYGPSVANLITVVTGQIDWSIYFKDA